MKYKKILNSLLVLALSGTMVWTAGCARLSQRLKPSPKPVLEKVHPSAYPAFLDDMALDGLEHGVAQSLAFYNRVPQTRKFKFGEDLFDTRHMIQTLEHFLIRLPVFVRDFELIKLVVEILKLRKRINPLG